MITEYIEKLVQLVMYRTIGNSVSLKLCLTESLYINQLDCFIKEKIKIRSYQFSYYGPQTGKRFGHL